MIPIIFLRYDTDSVWEACQRRKSRRILEETSRRDQEDASIEGRSPGAGVEPEQNQRRRRMQTAGNLGGLRHQMYVGSADITDLGRCLNSVRIQEE